jgi:hypothetical protein
MHSQLCEPLQKQGYQFFSPTSSAAVKPCLWCKAALAMKGMCYKHQFYGIESHRCIQMTPTLRCNQRCRFCWRSFEYTFAEEVECPPEHILNDIKKLQKRAEPMPKDFLLGLLWFGMGLVVLFFSSKPYHFDGFTFDNEAAPEDPKEKSSRRIDCFVMGHYDTENIHPTLGSRHVFRDPNENYYSKFPSIESSNTLLNNLLNTAKQNS